MSYGSFLEFVRMLKAEVHTAKGIRLKTFIFLYRVSSFGNSRGRLAKLLMFPLYVIYRGYGEFLLGMELPVTVIAGPGLRISHGHGLVVHRESKIGARCILRQGVTIGNKVTKDGVSGVPTISDDVEFGAGSMAIGDIHIGARGTIGACTVVTKDIPDDTIVVGQGIRLIPRE